MKTNDNRLTLCDTRDDRLLWVIASFLLIGFLIYGNSLHNDFLMDDFPRVLENADFRAKGFAPFDPETLRNQVYLRPVTDFFNFITFVFFGRNPVGYHVLSLSIYILAAAALYRLLVLLFGRIGPAYTAAALFLVHPINGVAVNYMNATSFPFMILAVHVSIIKSLRWAAGEDRSHNFITSYIWFVLALFCHEVAVAFPLYLTAAMHFGRNMPLRRALTAAWPYFAGVAVFIGLRALLLNSEANVTEHIADFRIGWGQYLTHYAQLLGWYFSRFFATEGIVLAWNTPVTAGASPLWTAGLAAAAALAAVIMGHRRIDAAYRFGVAWMVIGCLPVALACFSRPYLGFVVQPHWLFFSSVGFFTVLGRLLGCIPRPYYVTVVLILSLIYIPSSLRYNRRWSSEHRYCSYWLGISPDNFWPNFWLGHDYLSKGDLARARYFFLRAAKTPYKRKVVLGNLGIIALRKNQLSLAEAYFQQVLELDPADAQTYYYLGTIQRRTGQYRAAVFYLNKALEFDPYLKSATEELEGLIGGPRQKNGPGT